MPDGRHAALPLCDDDNRACERLSNGNYEDNTDGGTTPTKGVETGASGTGLDAFRRGGSPSVLSS